MLFVSLCRIPAVVSFLEGLRALPGTVPSLCPAHRLSPQLFLKRLEFNQNINFLLNPFKAPSSAACFLFHMPAEEMGMKEGRGFFWVEEITANSVFVM